MNLEVEVKTRATVKFSDIADQFADMESEEQAIFIYELFDALSFKCEEYSATQTQIMYIAKYIKDQNMKETINLLKSFCEFLEGKNETN